MAKAKTIEIKDLPILNVGGKNYYAFNVAIRYLKQNNKEQFKGMTMKKFKEVYGEDSIFKLSGCGSWMSVELFNELSNKLTKVVVKTLDEGIKSKEKVANITSLFFVKDEITAKIHQQHMANIPAEVKKELEQFELSTLGEEKKLIETLDLLIEQTKLFMEFGYSVKPYLYEDGSAYLVGNGVFISVNDCDWLYEVYDSTKYDWEHDKHGKLCKYVESYDNVKEHMEEFVPVDIDFTGLTPTECIIECYNRGLVVNPDYDIDHLDIDYGSVSVRIDTEYMLYLFGIKSSRESMENRMVDLSAILEQQGIVIEEVKQVEVDEYEPTIVEAEFYEIVDVEVVEPVEQVEVIDEVVVDVDDNEEVIVEVVEEVEVIEEVEPMEQYEKVEEVVVSEEVEEVEDPFKIADELGWDLGAGKFNRFDDDFKRCFTEEEIDKKYKLGLKFWGLRDFELDSYADCADYWTLVLRAENMPKLWDKH